MESRNGFINIAVVIASWPAGGSSRYELIAGLMYSLILMEM